ncbi:hypothetical protein [Raineyella sp.]|uniref:Uncharacterized protein n=1 Tax=bioreactor metagenome TaxID=1076179 RepID=A0A644XEE1_9ZZZZ|nr:hypothetical protein [Raineyella sp.]MEA5154097.1 hypothetical protein [Raineyella sp.]
MTDDVPRPYGGPGDPPFGPRDLRNHPRDLAWEAIARAGRPADPDCQVMLMRMADYWDPRLYVEAWYDDGPSRKVWLRPEDDVHSLTARIRAAIAAVIAERHQQSPQQP